MKLLNGDCLALMRDLRAGSVNMILADLPYGVTDCKWDSPIDLERMWAEYNRITTPNAAIVLTAVQPFTTALINSQPKLFRYSLVWDKSRGSDFLNAKRKILPCHEDVLVFYRRQPTYNPQWWYSTPYKVASRPRRGAIEGIGKIDYQCPETVSEDGRRYPLSILRFPRDGKRVHPTQKPVALCEYLIRTFSNEGDTILDNCMGSGSTGVACVNTDRQFIGMEFERKYFEMARERVGTAGHAAGARLAA